MYKKTSLVPLFVLADKATKVMEKVVDTLDKCEAKVVGENHIDALILG